MTNGRVALLYGWKGIWGRKVGSGAKRLSHCAVFNHVVPLTHG